MWAISCALTSSSRTSAQWDFTDAPVCKPITCEPLKLLKDQKIYNGRCNTMQQPIQSVCRVGCKENYRFLDDKHRDKTHVAVKCRLDPNNLTASWTSTVSSCKAVQCELRDMPVNKNYVRRHCPENAVGSQCQLICRQGYRINSTSYTWLSSCTLIRNSRSTAAWNFVGAPVCEPIQCDEKFPPPLKYYTGRCSEGSVGSRCQLNCKTGYRINSSSNMWATSCALTSSSRTSAQWDFTDTPVCKPITCNAITAQSFVVDVSCNISLNGLCPVSCQPAFKFAPPWSMQDEVTAICSLSSDNLSGVWKSDHPRQSRKSLPTPICEEIKCLRKNLTSNYQRTFCPEGSINERCRLQCSKGYKFRDKRVQKVILCTLDVSTKTAAWSVPECISWKNDGKGYCVKLNKKRMLSKSVCKGMFICERPMEGSDPCININNCSGNGECAPVGCSFRCQCQDLFFGDKCEKGSFTIEIKDVKNDKYRISLQNNAHMYTALFHFLVNGKEEWDMTLNPKANYSRVYNDLKKAEHETYLSVKASLNGRSEVVYSCKRIPGRLNLVNITNDQCNGNVLNVFWPGFINNPDSSMRYSVLVNNNNRGTARAGEWLKIGGLRRGTMFSIKVIPQVQGCDDLLQKEFNVTRFSTSEGLPEASNVSAPTHSSATRNCAINWTLNREANTGGYKVKIIEYVGLSKIINENEQINIARVTNKYNFTAKPNSHYDISVGTEALSQCQGVPLKWSTKVTGCITGTAGPDEIAVPLLDGGLSSVTLRPADERNGLISCYFVVMKVLNASMNSSEVITSIGLLKQANSTIEAGDSYVAFATPRFDGESKLQFGEGDITCCNISDPNGICKSLPERKRKKRATQNPDVVYGENHPLNPDFSYRHYVLVSTPSSDGDKPILTASPLSASWGISGHDSPIEDRTNMWGVIKETDSVALALTGIGAAIGMLILVTLAYCFKKHLTRRRSASVTEDPSRLYELPIEGNKYAKIVLPISSTNADRSNEQETSTYETVNVSATSM